MAEGLFGNIYDAQLQQQLLDQKAAQSYGTGWEAITRAAAGAGGMLGRGIGQALGGQTPIVAKQQKINQIQQEFAGANYDDPETFSMIGQRFMAEGFGDLSMEALEYGRKLKKTIAETTPKDDKVPDWYKKKLNAAQIFGTRWNKLNPDETPITLDEALTAIESMPEAGKGFTGVISPFRDFSSQVTKIRTEDSEGVVDLEIPEQVEVGEEVGETLNYKLDKMRGEVSGIDSELTSISNKLAPHNISRLSSAEEGMYRERMNQLNNRKDSLNQDITGIEVKLEKPIEQVGKKIMAQTGLKNWNRATGSLFDPKTGEIDRTLLGTAALNIPYTEGRTFNALTKDALQARLRLETGTAAPAPELVNMMQRYVPSIIDSDSTIKMKVQILNEFFENFMLNVDRDKLATMSEGERTNYVRGRLNEFSVVNRIPAEEDISFEYLSPEQKAKIEKVYNDMGHKFTREEIARSLEEKGKL